MKAINLPRVVARTTWGADQHTLLYMYLYRSHARCNSTMAVLSMALTYVYWTRYRTVHCDYASVPSEPHLPQVCVFKPMYLHSTYGE